MKKIFISFLILIFSLNTYSQSEQFGLWIGTSFYLGDLNPSPNKNFHKNINPALGIMYKRNHRNLRYSYRLQFMYGKVEAYDFQSGDAWQENRNLNFQSTILELGAIMEVNFVRYQVGEIKKLNKTPFLFFGLAGYNFKPKGLYNDSWYDLQALSTEGQETSLNDTKKYKLNQLAIPVGIGYKVNMSENLSFAFEAGARILFTDYLDDVSTKYVDPGTLVEEAGILSPLVADKSNNQVGDRNIGHDRGNSELNDWYFFTGFTFTYSFNKKSECEQRFIRK
ncbi:DUF6089 family protein [Flavobacteriales bacterium]|nr:DUF6089 family protein [Flavobacteriales bacterium]